MLTLKKAVEIQRQRRMTRWTTKKRLKADNGIGEGQFSIKSELNLT
jgi:hypothetical protein